MITLSSSLSICFHFYFIITEYDSDFLIHADELYIEIPRVYKKIGVVFSDNKIEVKTNGQGRA